MSTTHYPVSGSCQCGQVTFSLLAAPNMVIACHCKACQKLATSAFSITSILDKDKVVIEGELADWSRMADSGNENHAKFCPSCGNRIYHYDPKIPNILKFKGGASLDDTSMLIPTVHVWVSEKQDWFIIPEGVKTFDKQP
ncbi:putative lipoprotein [Marinomonas sp. MED121]|uniref:GFA family protein n=1 Tax=Marinomonas sp. MED121 TaxID=314277 RepID=UPI000069082A|nr:GFA family protein [Marinomonas sp. MED121]EAQ64534.1 putative lipoprotein [Marinomonas sp. MED121]